jgi:predicted nucleic acid-binding protein
MAYLLDTNIVSELRKGPKCSGSVRKWYDAVPFEDLYLSVLLFGELRRGVEKLRGRDATTARVLERWMLGLRSSYAERILAVSFEISEIWGSLSVHQPLPITDGLLAATALHYELTVVTRNTADFQRTSVDYINPFTS